MKLRSRARSSHSPLQEMLEEFVFGLMKRTELRGLVGTLIGSITKEVESLPDFGGDCLDHSTDFPIDRPAHNLVIHQSAAMPRAKI